MVPLARHPVGRHGAGRCGRAGEPHGRRQRGGGAGRARGHPDARAPLLGPGRSRDTARHGAGGVGVRVPGGCASDPRVDGASGSARDRAARRPIPAHARAARGRRRPWPAGGVVARDRDRAGAGAGVGGISPRLLRRAAAQHLLRQGHRELVPPAADRDPLRRMGRCPAPGRDGDVGAATVAPPRPGDPAADRKPARHHDQRWRRLDEQPSAAAPRPAAAAGLRRGSRRGSGSRARIVGRGRGGGAHSRAHDDTPEHARRRLPWSDLAARQVGGSRPGPHVAHGRELDRPSLSRHDGDRGQPRAGRRRTDSSGSPPST